MPKTVDPNTPWFTRPDKPNFKTLRAIKHKITSSHSLREINKRTGIDQELLSKYEQGASMTTEHAKLLAADFDCPHQLLIDGASKDLAKSLALTFSQTNPVVSQLADELEDDEDEVSPKNRKFEPVVGSPKLSRPSSKLQTLRIRNLTGDNVVLVVQRISDSDIEIDVRVDKKPTLVKAQKEVWLSGMVTQYSCDAASSNRRSLCDSEIIEV